MCHEARANVDEHSAPNMVDSLSETLFRQQSRISQKPLHTVRHCSNIVPKPEKVWPDNPNEFKCSI